MLLGKLSGLVDFKQPFLTQLVVFPSHFPSPNFKRHCKDGLLRVGTSTIKHLLLRKFQDEKDQVMHTNVWLTLVGWFKLHHTLTVKL